MFDTLTRWDNLLLAYQRAARRKRGRGNVAAFEYRLEDNLQHYLPDFPYPGITIRHLLTHTSGLPDLELYEPLVKKYPDTIITNEIIIPVLIQEKRPLYFHPGDKFSYCNTFICRQDLYHEQRWL